jgi:Acetyl esterase (deacetylase)
MTEAQLYELLSYFDIKNLAGWIKCPVIMASGLQDEVCPPHTNFSGYNRINTEKEYHIYPTYGHDVPSVWWNIRMNFFKNHLK